MIDSQFTAMRTAVNRRWTYWLRCWLWRIPVAELLQRVSEMPLSSERANLRIRELEIELATAQAKAHCLPELTKAKLEADTDRLEALRVKQESEVALTAAESELAKIKADAEMDRTLRQAAEDKAIRLESELGHWKEQHHQAHTLVQVKDRHVRNLLKFTMTSRRLSDAAPNGSILEILRETNGR